MIVFASLYYLVLLNKDFGEVLITTKFYIDFSQLKIPVTEDIHVTMFLLMMLKLVSGLHKEFQQMDFQSFYLISKEEHLADLW